MTIDSVGSAWNPTMVPRVGGGWSSFESSRTAAGAASEPSADSASGAASGSSAAWQFATGYYEPSKAEPIIVYPRPNASSHASERHRLAPAGRRWSIPVSMYSGAWPFQYIVDPTSAAKGIEIGTSLELVGGVLTVPDDYAELSWDNPTVGTHTITLTVRTQEYGRNTSGFGDEKTVTFDLVVAAADDTTKFVWISGSGNDTTGTGTPSNPFRTLSKVFNSTAYSGRQLHMLSGTYDTNGSGVFNLNATTPAVMVGDDGAVVTISMTQRAFGYSGDGCYAAGFEVTDGGYGATVSDCRVFTVNSNVDNWVFHRVAGTNLSNGTAGTDNPTLIFGSGGGGSTPRVNCVVSRCSDSGRTYTSNSGSLFILFACDQGVAEFNSISGAGRYNAVLKDSNRRWSVRCNSANLSGGAEIAFSTGCQLQSYTTQDIEISENSSNREIRFNYQAVTTSGVHHIFRNSVTGGIGGWNTSTSTTGPYNIDKNAVEGTVVTGSRVNTTNAECHASNGVLDASNKLEGTYRTNYLGRRGAELIMGT